MTQDEFSEQLVTLFNQIHEAKGFDLDFGELMYMRGQQSGPDQATFTLVFNTGKKQDTLLNPKRIAAEVEAWANETMSKE